MNRYAIESRRQTLDETCLVLRAIVTIANPGHRALDVGVFMPTPTDARTLSAAALSEADRLDAHEHAACFAGLTASLRSHAASVRAAASRLEAAIAAGTTDDASAAADGASLVGAA